MTSRFSSSHTLHRLVYYSRQQFPDIKLDHEITAILAASVRNNAKDAVSGLLLTHQNWFVQALEGTATAVQHTLGRISNDPRHSQVRVISTGPIEARQFGDWNMCARGLARADDAILKILDQRGDFDPAKLSPASALRLLTMVKDIRHDIAARQTA